MWGGEPRLTCCTSAPTCSQLSHMPPELVLHGTVSRAVDVYSFGVLLWQMYTGSRPWSGLTHSQIIMLIGSGVSG